MEIAQPHPTGMGGRSESPIRHLFLFFRHCYLGWSVMTGGGSDPPSNRHSWTALPGVILLELHYLVGLTAWAPFVFWNWGISHPRARKNVEHNHQNFSVFDPWDVCMCRNTERGTQQPTPWDVNFFLSSEFFECRTDFRFFSSSRLPAYGTLGHDGSRTLTYPYVKATALESSFLGVPKIAKILARRSPKNFHNFSHRLFILVFASQGEMERGDLVYHIVFFFFWSTHIPGTLSKTRMNVWSLNFFQPIFQWGQHGVANSSSALFYADKTRCILFINPHNKCAPS